MGLHFDIFWQLCSCLEHVRFWAIFVPFKWLASFHPTCGSAGNGGGSGRGQWARAMGAVEGAGNYERE